MAKIIKVGSQNLTPNKIANPFKTSRNSTTNPFKYNNFDGNTLPFELAADVFETKSPNKLKMIASSVTGSMNKMKSLLPESIINFVNRVREGISSAWDYAKNTNVSDIPAIKAFNDVMNTPIHIPALSGLSESMTSIGKGITSNIQSVGKGISSRMEFLNTDVTDIGKAMADRWTSLISSIKPNRISSDMPVAELRQLWLNEIELEGAVA
ncbi:hypothetical protein IJD34_05505 [bacterium]|nr:hypothetical protein [bacterium]